MAEYYSSEECTISTTSSSDPPIATTFIRKEREISMKKTISLSKLFSRRDAATHTTMDANFTKDAACNTTATCDPPVQLNPEVPITQLKDEVQPLFANKETEEARRVELNPVDLQLLPELENMRLQLELNQKESKCLPEELLFVCLLPAEEGVLPEQKPKDEAEEAEGDASQGADAGETTASLTLGEESTPPPPALGGVPPALDPPLGMEPVDPPVSREEMEEPILPPETPETWPTEAAEARLLERTEDQPALRDEPLSQQPTLPPAAEGEPVAPAPTVPEQLPWVEAMEAQPLLREEPPLPQPSPPPPSEEELPVPALPPVMESSTPAPTAPEEPEGPPPQAAPEDECMASHLSSKDKPTTVKRTVSRGTSPIKPEVLLGLQWEKEALSQMDDKDRPLKKDNATSCCKFDVLAAAQRERTVNDTMGEFSSSAKQASSGSTSAMVNSINSFVDSHVGRVFADTMDRALDKSQEWLNYYLPLPETSVGPSESTDEESEPSSPDHCKEGCFMRISALSTQLRNRAFKAIVHQLKLIRQSTSHNLSLLDLLLDLLDGSYTLTSSSFKDVPEQLTNMWAQWCAKADSRGTKPPAKHTVKGSISLLPEQLEMKAISLTRILTRELYDTYHNLLPHVGELPAHLQEKVSRVYEGLEELQTHLSTSASLRDLPSHIVLQSRQKIASARENLDELLDFMAQNPPGQWLAQPSSSRAIRQPIFGTNQPVGETSRNTGPGEGSASQQMPLPPPSPPRL